MPGTIYGESLNLTVPLYALVNAVTTGTPYVMLAPGLTVEAKWVATQPGRIIAVSGFFVATSNAATYGFEAYKNGSATGILTTPIAFNGGIQPVYSSASLTPVSFVRGDYLEIYAKPSGTTPSVKADATITVQLDN